jgi:fermentation-respiration switch protein FrsA (DUF1100 family)
MFALSHDPAATLRKVSCPMLAINGGKDRQNLAQENLPAIEAALRKSSHKDFLVKELPGLNHFFQTCETGSESEYGEIEETLSPAALELIAAWILEHSNK